MNQLPGAGRLVVVGVIGQGTHEGAPSLSDRTKVLAQAVGEAVARRGAILLTGGQGGVMEAASRGAKEAGGLTLGMLPGLDHQGANPYLDIALTTGLGRARNLVIARGSDSLVMIGGGAGTLNELTIAYSERTPVIVIKGSGGWADRLPGILLDGRYLDERRRTPFHFEEDPKAAVDLALMQARATRTRRSGFTK